MTVSVVVVTMNRPGHVQTCLDRLAAQVPRPDQVIVIDASPDDRTRDVVARHPGVLYRRNELGYGHMTASRNIGLAAATGDVVSFIDDDAFAHPGWLAGLLDAYRLHPEAAAVGGRALNNNPNEATAGLDNLGRIRPNGEICGYFAADPGGVIEVDHMVGCNMSFRRETLARLGGFRDDFPGTEVCEESDMSVRVKRIGGRIFFTPFAVVDHVAAPQVKGKRFDARYAYWGQRNHVMLLVRNYGFGMITWRYLAHTAWRDAKGLARRLLAGPGHWKDGVMIALGTAWGTVVGLKAGVALMARNGLDPVRRDDAGAALSKWLMADSAAEETAPSPAASPVPA
jgi:GT2 family glycosyltransferase